MKLSPFQLYLRSLARGQVRLGHLSKEDAYEGLKRLTGEDFGYDVERWRQWGKEHPDVSKKL